MVGPNGSGKSTFLDALTYVLFGKPFRNIVKPALINSVNEKGLLVEIEFSTNGKEYKISRGMKPNIFEIYCNGILLNQESSSKDYQDYLEKNILKMSYKTFTQIVILGSAAFTPFMQLAPAIRRKIIEDILDIEIFSTMNILTKQKIINNKSALEKNKIALEGKKEKISFIRKTLKGLKQNSEDKKNNIKNNIEEYQNIIYSLESNISKLELNQREYLEKASDLPRSRNKHKELISIQSNISSKMQRKKKDINFFKENDSCPTCRQPIDLNFKETEIELSNIKISEYSEALDKLQETVNDTILQINELDEYVRLANDLSVKITENKTKLNHYNDLLKSFLNELEIIENSDTLVKTNEFELEKAEREIEELELNKEKLLNERQFLEIALNLLKDGGIKTKIIKQYLPIINKQINKYLSMMGLFVNFEMNEEFEESIKSRFRDNFSYESFSEGEKMRINLAILLTWRDITKMRNNSYTNLLIFDEVLDSSLDFNGHDGFLKLIGESDTNIFIISHSLEYMSDKFDKTIKFRKDRNYSQIVS